MGEAGRGGSKIPSDKIRVLLEISQEIMVILKGIGLASEARASLLRNRNSWKVR